MMYSRQKDPLFEARLLARAARASAALMFPRQAGIKKGIELDRRRHALLLPAGPRLRAEALGVRAVLRRARRDRDRTAYIARTTGAAVVPCVTRMLPGGGGYVARLYPAVERLSERRRPRRRAAHDGLHRGAGAGDARAVLLAAQAVQDAPAGRGEVLLKLAVIGAGHMGRFHAEKFARLPGVELAAVVDPDPARAPISGFPESPGRGRRRGDRGADQPAPRGGARLPREGRARADREADRRDARRGRRPGGSRVEEEGWCCRSGTCSATATPSRRSRSAWTARSTSTPSASPASSSAAPRST